MSEYFYSNNQKNQGEACCSSNEAANGPKNSVEKNIAKLTNAQKNFSPSWQLVFYSATREMMRQSQRKSNGSILRQKKSSHCTWSLDPNGNLFKHNSLTGKCFTKHRSSNSIKNRFYTVVRAFLKVLFRQHPLIKKKLPHEIPSKLILKFYEGRQEFVRFKGFGKRILKSVDYDLESLELKTFAQNNLEDIKVPYDLVFVPKQKNSSTKSAEKAQKKKSKVEQKQKEDQIEPIIDNKVLSKTDVCYEPQEQNLANSPHLNFPNGDIPQMPQMSFMFMPTSNYYGMMGYNQYFTYY